MFKFLRAFALLAMIISNFGASAEQSNQFLCIVEHAAGLRYDNQTKAWKPAAFATGAKYLVRRINQADLTELQKKYPRANWVFSAFGEKTTQPIAVCDDDGGHSSIFFCTVVTGAASVEFFSSALRFEIVRSGGYVVQGGLEQAVEKTPASTRILSHRVRRFLTLTMPMICLSR